MTRLTVLTVVAVLACCMVASAQVVPLPPDVERPDRSDAYSRPTGPAHGMRAAANWLAHVARLDGVGELGQARAVSLAAADVDEDGTPDLVCGMSSAAGGFILVYPGNPSAVFPRAGESRRSFDAARAPVFVAETPDLVATGDFDADGHIDVVSTTKNARHLDWLRGNGSGDFDTPRRIEVPGKVTALGTGDFDRPDGLADLVVGVLASEGYEALIFRDADGALDAAPRHVALPGAASAFVVKRGDLLVAAGRELVVVLGDSATTLQSFDAPIRSAALGEFVHGAERTREVALLLDDGSLYVHGLAADRFPSSGLDPNGSLLTARVSGLPLDELVVLDPAARVFRAMLGEVAVSSSGPAVFSESVVSLPGRPVAALTMRLNGDAQSDLVFIADDDPIPWVLTSTAAATFTVTNVNDGGGGSLRSAIDDANSSGGADLIQFAIPGAGPHEIALLSPLPVITQPLTIDGYSQPGAVANSAPLSSGTNAMLRVEIDGSDAGLGANGLRLAAGGCSIRGLIIQDFDLDGVSITGDGNIIEGNFIGTDDSGTLDDANNNGVLINTATNTIVGGTQPAARNLISGNNDDGIDLRTAFLPGNQILGNLIGTDRSGVAALNNASDGVQIDDSTLHAVGGTAAGAGNVIAANDSDGLDVSDSMSILIQANVIGLGADGDTVVGNNTGVRIVSGANTVGGTSVAARNVISGNTSTGVVLLGADATLNFVQGNFLGTDATGLVDRGNGLAGIIVQNAPGNTVGGISSGAANLISGNDNMGASMQLSGATGNVVQGNLIGTDISGSLPLPNTTDGVRIASASGNQIGGALPGEGNVLSGNGKHGVLIFGIESSGNSILGNLIGTDPGGTTAVPNADEGILIQDAPSNFIGDPATGARNVISGNGAEGVAIRFPQATENLVRGNTIGVDVNGGPLGNGSAGVTVDDASNNTIGGIVAGEGNRIENNGAAGITVLAGASNALLGNSIVENASIGIDLGGDGVTPNDDDDADTGPNGFQNFPVLSSATVDPPGTVTIEGSLNAQPSTSFRVEFFASDGCDATGHGEGRIFLGFVNVATDTGGDASFSVPLPGPAEGNDTFTSTATGGINGTSEFSACVASGCGAPATFGATVLAADRDTLDWGTTQDVHFAKGALSDVDVYAVLDSGLLAGASSLDISQDSPSPGAGLYYVVRPALCGSWQTTPGAEPNRDLLLP